MRKANYLLLFTIVSVLFSCKNDGSVDAVSKEEITSDSVKAKIPEIKYNDSTVIFSFKGSDASVNDAYLKSATEPIKAILAYYCYQFSSSCENGKNCKLTSALGFEQDSPEHKKLVLKWFTDEETKLSIENGGNVKSSTEDNFSWFSSIVLFQNKNNIKVKYASSWVTKDLHGKGNGNDNYIIEGNNIKVINRNHTELDVQ